MINLNPDKAFQVKIIDQSNLLLPLDQKIILEVDTGIDGLVKYLDECKIYENRTKLVNYWMYKKTVVWMCHLNEWQDIIYRINPQYPHKSVLKISIAAIAHKTA